MNYNCVIGFSMLSRGYILLFITSCIMISTLGCKSSDQNETANKTSNKISVNNTTETNITWLAPWYGEGQKETMMREAGREYAFYNQDINMNTIFTVDAYPDQFWWSAVSAGILDMIKKDEWPYDVLICEKGHYRVIANSLNDPNWAQKYFVDFSQEDWFINAHRDGILASSSLKNNYQGIIPGPILEGTIYCLYVSTEVEEKLGLKVKRLNMDFDDFMGYAETVYKYNQTHTDKISFFSTQDASAISRLFKHLTLTAYGHEYFSSKQESFAALAKAYDAFERLSKYNPTERFIDYGTKDENDIQYTLNEKDYLFNMEATWIYNIWQGSNPEGTKLMKPCELPSFDGKTPPYYEGDFQTIFAVPKRGKHVEEAKKLIQYLTSNDVGEKWINYSRCPTGLKTRISMTDFGQEEFDVFFRHMEAKYGIKFKETDLYTLLWGKSPGYTYDEPSFNADFFHQDVITGKISGRKALERVRAKYQ